MTSEGTPRRTIRVSDDIWLPAEERAAREGRGPLVNVIRDFLLMYGNTEGKEQK